MGIFRRSSKVEQRSSPLVSVSNPFLLEYLGAGTVSYSGVHVTESSALTLSAVYRAVSIITGTIAALPMRSLDTVNDERERFPSWLDDPAGPDSYTPFEWKELVLLHLLLHGNAYLLHRYNGAGTLVGLNPIHPLAVNVEWDSERPGGKKYTVTLINGQTIDLDSSTLTHIMGMSLDGLQGISPIAAARNSMGAGIAGDRAAAKMFVNGAMISGMVTTADENVKQDDALTIKKSIREKVSGIENAGDIAFINRNLKFTPWQLSAVDAQFLESRQFAIEEVARWFGVPANLLMKTDAVSTWGTGVEIVNRGLKTFTLLSWTVRIEQRLSRLLPGTRFVEFDFSGLERPSPEDEIDLLIKQLEAGILTLDEVRRIRNLPPLPAGELPADGEPAKTGAEARQLNLIEQIQKIYLGVGTVLTWDEARKILNRSGAELDLTIPQGGGGRA